MELRKVLRELCSSYSIDHGPRAKAYMFCKKLKTSMKNRTPGK